MKRIVKRKGIAAIGYLLLTLVVLIAIFETAGMLYGKLTNDVNALFGYCVNTAVTDMTGTTIKAGDKVLTVPAGEEKIKPAT